MHMVFNHLVHHIFSCSAVTENRTVKSPANTIIAIVLLFMTEDTEVFAGMNVKVKQNGQSVPGATVCVGTAGLLNSFGQTTTDTLGNATFNNVPNDPLVVTAHFGTQAAQLQQSANATGFTPPLDFVILNLQPGITARCPGSAITPTTSIVAGAKLAGNKITPIAPVRILPPAQHCFGAIGNQCGQSPIPGIPLSALCANGHCMINAGSWQHDECCWLHPRGTGCQVGSVGEITANDGNCAVSWNKAFDRLGRNLSWVRNNIDFNETNTSGTVVFFKYCSPTGSIVDRNDVSFCCNHNGIVPAPANRSPLIDWTKVRVCN